MPPPPSWSGVVAGTATSTPAPAPVPEGIAGGATSLAAASETLRSAPALVLDTGPILAGILGAPVLRELRVFLPDSVRTEVREERVREEVSAYAWPLLRPAPVSATAWAEVERVGREVGVWSALSATDREVCAVGADLWLAAQTAAAGQRAPRRRHRHRRAKRTAARRRAAEEAAGGGVAVVSEAGHEEMAVGTVVEAAVDVRSDGDEAPSAADSPFDFVSTLR